MEKNLLEEWYKETKVLSSPLSINPLVSRRIVDFIYNILLDFFGHKFFTIIIGRDKPIEKIFWIHPLLINSRHRGSIYALYEIAYLIDYSNSLDKGIQIELNNLKTSPEVLRTFFFELYIYQKLDYHNIVNSKKVITGNQTLEGIFNINQTDYLFECRKVFLPNISDLDILRRIQTDFWRESNANKAGIGLICTLKIKRPITGKHRFSFHEKIKSFFKELSRFRVAPEIKYRIDDEFGIFHAINFDEASLVEIKNRKEYDILFYIQPTNVMTKDGMRYIGKIVSNFSVAESKIYDKLKAALKEKKRQHRNSSYNDKVIIIDNEVFPEFHMGLFHNEKSYDIKKVEKVYKDLNLEEILIIVHRNYADDKPKIKVDFVCQGRHEKTAKLMQQVLTVNSYDY